MRVDTRNFIQANLAKSKETRFVIEMSFDPANTNLRYFPSHADAATPYGVIAYDGTIIDFSSTTQKLDPITGISTIGDLKFTILDYGAQLSNLLTTAKEGEVRVSAAMALCRVGGANEAIALAWYTNSTEVAELRRACAIALGELGRQESLDTLVALLGDDDRRLAQLAANSLIQFGEAGIAKLVAVEANGLSSGRAARGAMDLAKLRGQIATHTGDS